MLRVISGVAKGHKLITPRDSRIRPTADRVKEALFDILGERVKGARVLDLYAGSGALGIEALSRGAKEALFIDINRTSIEAIKRNLEKTRFSSKAKVMRGRVSSILKKLYEGAGKAFDLIFLDPPYKISFNELNKVFQILFERNLISGHGLIILEFSSRRKSLEPAGFEIKSVKTYGDTNLIIYQRLDS